MNKYIFCMVFLLLAGLVSAQKKKSMIMVLRSETSHGTKMNGADVMKVYKAVFQQDYSILSSDSAYFYPNRNAFDAFGHVVITQGDTLHIYSDLLNYDGNTKIAVLTNHVKLVDKDATLTTDFFTYNTGTRIGTYTGGGKLVNKENTLVSKNGFYFASSRDAYFRYDVVLNTIDAIIKTDTLRYNSGTRIAYFYGPTHIYGKKDKDTLYTENGTYETKSEQAAFGKNNWYKQGTKSLKGDSLFYDRLKGYGRAVKHVTFDDSEQKITIKGDLAVYTKADEKTVVTEHAYAILVTQDTDKTHKDTLSAGLALPLQLKDTTIVKLPNAKPQTASKTTKPDRNTNAPAKTEMPDLVKPHALSKAPYKIKRDSVVIAADTIMTRIPIFKELKAMQEQQRLSALRDTSVHIVRSEIYTKVPKELFISPPQLPKDTSFLHTNFFAKMMPRDTAKKAVKPPAARRPSRQKLSNRLPNVDTLFRLKEVVLSDTAKVRIVSAWHHAKMFKSDLQSKADSIFYSYSDSTIRMYVKPMIWAEGSQLSGDTIYMQLRNKKFDNILLFPSAFIVNIVKNDSVNFNQVAGRRMRGFFKDSKINRVFVDGNAETIYFSRDSASNRVTEMARTLSSRINVYFKNSNVSVITWIDKPELRDGPAATFKDDQRILKGFLWKPKERPLSKESIIPQLLPPVVGPKNPPKKDIAVKTRIKSGTKPGIQAGLKVSTNLSRPDSLKAPADTLKAVKIRVDSGKAKLN